MQRRRSFHFVFLLFSLAMFCAATAVTSPAQTYSFTGNGGSLPGANPFSGLVQGRDGNLYGTTMNGGANGSGEVFKINPAGSLIWVYNFCSQGGCTDGAVPDAALVQGTDGNFYGTTRDGGAAYYGTVFKITPAGQLTTLYSFCPQSGCNDGANPYAALVQGTDGNFYGTTYSGGANYSGTVFKITPSGSLIWVYSFCSISGCLDGAGPWAGLLQATDGNFYGTTYSGGANYNGTVFRITPTEQLTTLHTFEGADGISPAAGLIQGTDGNLYGTTVYGGNNNHCGNCGTVFKITPQYPYTLTTLHNFAGNPSDGANPYAELVQATDGNFYGTTYGGGANYDGTVFKMTPGGTVTTVHSFEYADGVDPYAGLLQGTDGSFYGTTFYGGYGYGTVFNLSMGLAPFVETEPTSGNVGAPVIILGTNLTGSTSVTFNGTPAAFIVVSASEITTNVPSGATTGPVQVKTPRGTLSSNVNFRVITSFQLVPVTPCRLVDTRPEYGGKGPIQGGTARSFNLPQLAKSGGCADLSTAAAYSLNVTAVPQGTLGFLTIWPTGEGQPYVSTLNSIDGRVKANAAIVPAGSQGAVSVYVTDTANVVLDIDGYFALVNNSTLAFYPLTPCRVADTRNPKSDLGGPSLTGGKERDFPVLESSCIPANANAAAYSFNFTVVPHEPLGFLAVWPAGQPQPNVSTLNAPTGTFVANAAIVPAGTPKGAIAVYPTNPTDLVIDINGYFAAQGSGGLSLYPVTPCRVLDTRLEGGLFFGTLPVNVVGSGCAPQGTAEAYVLNATVVPQAILGFLTLWPDGEGQPYVSTLNAVDGAFTSNMAIVPTNNGSIDAYATDLTQLILDISAYFAP